MGHLGWKRTQDTIGPSGAKQTKGGRRVTGSTAMNTVGRALVALFLSSYFMPLNQMVTAFLFVNSWKLMPFLGNLFPSSGFY